MPASARFPLCASIFHRDKIVFAGFVALFRIVGRGGYSINRQITWRMGIWKQKPVQLSQVFLEGTISRTWPSGTQP
jgi:hypothetical protein